MSNPLPSSQIPTRSLTSSSQAQQAGLRMDELHLGLGMRGPRPAEIPRTPRISPFSPFVSSLLITNLPPHILPKHLTYILSTNGDRGGDKHDHGISFIRIYTKPRKRAPKPLLSRLFTTHHPSSSRNTASRRVKDASTPNATPPLSPTSVPSTRPSSPGGTPRPSREGAPAREGATSRVEEVHPDPTPFVPFAIEGDEDEVTIAEVRFRTEYHYALAVRQLRRSTIDGRKIGLKEKHWDGAALRRLWRRMT